jgi:hypothetical protein
VGGGYSPAAVPYCGCCAHCLCLAQDPSCNNIQQQQQGNRQSPGQSRGPDD